VKWGNYVIWRQSSFQTKRKTNLVDVVLVVWMFQSTLSCFFPVFFPLCTALLIFTNQEWLSKANSKCFYKLLNCQEESFVFHFKWITLIETFHEYIKSKVASLRSRYFACLKGFKDYLRLYFHVSGFKDSGFFCSGKKGTKIEKFVLKRWVPDRVALSVLPGLFSSSIILIQRHITSQIPASNT
jgi:hypothetical protein